MKHQEERKFGLFPYLLFSEAHMQEQYPVWCFCPVVAFNFCVGEPVFAPGAFVSELIAGFLELIIQL